MKYRTSIIVIFLGLTSLFLSACGVLLAYPQVDSRPDIIATAVQATVIAQLTEVADPLNSTPLQQPPTNTATPTEQPPQPTATSTVPPTATHTPAPTYTPTATPIPCDWAEFVADRSVNDGTVMRPREEFTKIWRLKNVGSCSWNTGYHLVFVGGSELGAKTVIPLSASVLPGGTIDLPVRMFAPEKPGSYRGYWQLRNAHGLLFGIGEGAQNSFWVDIQVEQPEYKKVFDFAADYCEADWYSGARPLRCRGPVGGKAGFVHYLEDPYLENRHENEPTLWVQPNLDPDGWISGTYPRFKVRDGDRFRAWVGCMDNTKGCKVEFRLDYLKSEGGAVKNLGRWRENYDGDVSVIDLDLSDLAGKKVYFILTVRVRENPDQAQAFWFVPHIDRPVE